MIAVGVFLGAPTPCQPVQDIAEYAGPLVDQDHATTERDFDRLTLLKIGL